MEQTNYTLQNYVVVTAIEHHRVKYVVPTSILVKGNEISHAKDLVEADCISDFSNELLTTDIVSAYIQNSLVE